MNRTCNRTDCSYCKVNSELLRKSKMDGDPKQWHIFLDCQYYGEPSKNNDNSVTTFIIALILVFIFMVGASTIGGVLLNLIIGD